MNHDDHDLERLLRSALDNEARAHEPAGDGLVRIRQRVARRRHWSVWFKPTLALAGAAVVIASVLAVPSYLTGRDDVPVLVDSANPARPAPLSEPATASAQRSGPGSPTAPGPLPGTRSGQTGGTTPTGSPSPSDAWGTPIGGDPELPDRVALWPYPSRRIGHDRADDDVASGRYPNLSDAGQTAVDFVASYLGSEQGLSATRLGRADPGVQMLVQRRTAAGETVPVSNVFLVRVRKADDSPYVVLGASRATLGDSLTIFPTPRLSGTDPLTITGNVRREPDAADPTIRVSLREPGATEDLALTSTTVELADASPRTWTAELTPFRPLAGTGVVAAWTTDEDGQVLEFVATAISP
jgi:hypothetical protein